MKTTTLKKITFLLLLLAFCSACVNDDSVADDEIIKLEVFDFEGLTLITDAVMGDGETILTIRATIPEDSDANSRTVTFRASNNAMFQGVDASLDTDIAGEDGIAEVKLRMPLDDNPVFVSASITKGDNTYTSESSIELFGVGDIVSLELIDAVNNPINDPQRADGQSLITLKATVNFNQDEFNNVTFEKSAGEFQSVSGDNAIQMTDENHTATIDLKLPNQVERLYLSAKVGTSTLYFEEVELDLLRAFPDQIIIEPNTLSMQEDATNVIQVFLNRNFGQVSEDTPATFEAFQLINGTEVEVGRFTGLDGAQTNADGQITVDFKTDTDDFDFGLPVIIRVTSQNDDGDPVQSSISITLDQ